MILNNNQKHKVLVFTFKDEAQILRPELLSMETAANVHTFLVMLLQGKSHAHEMMAYLHINSAGHILLAWKYTGICIWNAFVLFMEPMWSRVIMIDNWLEVDILVHIILSECKSTPTVQAYYIQDRIEKSFRYFTADL